MSDGSHAHTCADAEWWCVTCMHPHSQWMLHVKKKKKSKTKHMHGSVAQQSTPRFILGHCSMIQHLSGCNKAAEHLSAGGDQLGHYICPGIESGQQGEWFLKPALSFSSLTNLISCNAASQQSRRKTSPSLVRKHQKTDQGAAGACRTPFCASATKPLFH